MLTVLTGGARSGKSALAVELGLDHDGPVVFVATCPRIDGDHEIDRRIDLHRAERPDTWVTVEAEHDLVCALARPEVADEALVIIDCLTLWVGNRQYRGVDEGGIVAESLEVLAAVAARGGPTVVVTNEVGMGIVPAAVDVRAYRDTLGRVNRDWVVAADRALLLIAGRALALHDPQVLLS